LHTCHNAHPSPNRRLRQLAGVSASSYLEQLCQHGALRLLGSPGKSGAMFFLSADEKFLVKTIHRDEFKLLARLLPR
jgi:1-phosphatidylinositol-4-phosphate 5-kinase